MGISTNIVGFYRKPFISQVVLQSLLSQVESIITFSLQEIVSRSILVLAKESSREDKEFWEKIRDDLETMSTSLQDMRKRLDDKYGQV